MLLAKKSVELLNGQSGLPQDALNGASFEIPAGVERHGNVASRIGVVNESAVAAGCPGNNKSRVLQSADNSRALRDGIRSVMRQR